jgi:hypothetical protein
MDLNILIFSKRCLNINLEDENHVMNENKEFPNLNWSDPIQINIDL